MTRELVNIDSTTYNEGAVGTFLYELLEKQWYSVEKQPVPHPLNGGGTGERFNVYAGMPGVRPDVVLSTHMDTVPPYIAFREDDEYMYGRGTCDAKGIIAAQVAAAELLRDAGVKVGMLFVVGEERDSAGAIVANMTPKGSKYLIDGEPTDNRLALASKGALRVEIRAKGKLAHSAYPELGDSAIHKMVEALNDLLALKLPVDPEVGDTTLNIGVMEGGRAPNVVADKAEALLLVRTVGPSQEIRDLIRRTVGERADVSFSLDQPFVRMRKLEGMETMVAKFSTDIPSLTNWGEPLLLGPGSIHVAHTNDERLSKRELLEAVQLYVKLAKRLVE